MASKHALGKTVWGKWGSTRRDSPLEAARLLTAHWTKVEEELGKADGGPGCCGQVDWDGGGSAAMRARAEMKASESWRESGCGGWCLNPSQFPVS